MNEGGKNGLRLSQQPGLRRRIVLAVLLASCALVLVLLNIATEKIGQRAGRGRSTAGRTASSEDAALVGINSVVDTLLAHYQIDRHSVKSWYVQTPDKRFVRLERRVIVSPDFVSMKFNLDLNRMVSALGARAMATERTKESTVTMHIVKDKMIVQSITFVMQSGSHR
jgi:hypothetical protein